jgi:hypothetical protein
LDKYSCTIRIKVPIKTYYYYYYVRSELFRNFLKKHTRIMYGVSYSEIFWKSILVLCTEWVIQKFSEKVYPYVRSELFRNFLKKYTRIYIRSEFFRNFLNNSLCIYYLIQICKNRKFRAICTYIIIQKCSAFLYSRLKLETLEILKTLEHFLGTPYR